MIHCCKDCKDREIGCHGRCERYIEEKRIVDEQNEKIRAGYYGFGNVRFGDKNGHRVMRRHKPVSTHGRINKI